MGTTYSPTTNCSIVKHDQLMDDAYKIRDLAIASAKHDFGDSDSVLTTYDSYYFRGYQDIVHSFADVPKLFEPFTNIPTSRSFDHLSKQMFAVLDKLSSGHMCKDPLTGKDHLANQTIQLLGPGGAADDITPDLGQDRGS